VGASGAIAGVMAAFLVRLAARRIEFLVLPIPIVWTFRFRLKLPAFV
jgi:membrane associated rhomboid family serine protease